MTDDREKGDVTIEADTILLIEAGALEGQKRALE